MNKRSKVFEDLERLAPIIPFPLYWLDTNGVFLGGNELCLEVTGAKSLDEFIGKSYDQIHPKGIAEELVNNINLVIETASTIEREEFIKDFTTGKIRYFLAIRSPLYDNGKIVGIIATSIDITAKKEAEAEALRIQNEKYEVEKKLQEKLIGLFDAIINLVHNYKMDIVDGGNRSNNFNQLVYRNVRLSKREEQVLYLLSMGKSPKDIARILSKLDGKVISHKTIASVINKQLYSKLDATNYSDLIEKATRLQLIKFMPASLIEALNKKLAEEL